MRLLNTRTQRLETHSGPVKPLYAILSHTWGHEEVTFEDIQAPQVPESKHGWKKILGACKQARNDGFNLIWIDTCCIDKSSSSELSEAINSMFAWYKSAMTCYAYLDDVIEDMDLHDIAAIEDVRWFTRGWTLQELLAPSQLIFFSRGWRNLGSKSELQDLISSRTGIDPHVLQGSPLSQVSVAQRMSWASHRQTTRPEDMAYCLMGIFGVHMPLLYGEGENAFIRLQEEIMKDSDDESIFAWDWDASVRASSPPLTGILASTPYYFRRSSNLVPYNSPLEPYTITNRGLRINIPMIAFKPGEHIAVLHCRRQDDLGYCVGIPLYTESKSSDRFYRDAGRSLEFLSTGSVKSAEERTIFINKAGLRMGKGERASRRCHVRMWPKNGGIQLCDAIARYGDSNLAIEWNMKERSFSAVDDRDGWNAALRFSISGPDCDTIEFGVVTVLPPNSLGKVTVFRWNEEEKETDVKLMKEIWRNFQDARYTEASMKTGHGLLHAVMKREDVLGEKIHVLDVSVGKLPQFFRVPVE